MRWTIKECSFVQRLDERERDSVLGLACQPHIDPVLISNDYRSKSHFEGATGKASGSLNWLMGEFSFSCARDSVFLGLHSTTTKWYERRACHVIFAESHISRTRNFSHFSTRPLPDQIHREPVHRLFSFQ